MKLPHWSHDPDYRDAERRYNQRDHATPVEAYHARVQALRDMRAAIERYEVDDEVDESGELGGATA